MLALSPNFADPNRGLCLFTLINNEFALINP